MRAISTLIFDAGMSTRLCFARQALRMRVRQSATGSVMTIISGSYQLALRTPGISPLSAISRKQMRHSPNCRRNARARPQRLQRFTRRTSNLGFLLLAIQDFFATLPPLDARGARRCSARLRLYGLTLRLSAERHAERAEQRECFVVALGRRHEGDVHSVNHVHLVVIHLGKDQLLLDPQRIVPAAVERARGNTAEVADTGN